MSPGNENPSGVTASRLLKGAALTFAALGAGMAAWGIDKWIRYPEVRATQFGVDAPLWPAFVFFVVLSTTAVVALLCAAAGRVEKGENLFAQRHRRQRSDSQDAGGPRKDDP